jgi:cobaltochelatase CobN
MADKLNADQRRAAKLLFLTTADTEILAAARATELLPEGFLEIVCCNPARLEDAGKCR